MSSTAIERSTFYDRTGQSVRLSAVVGKGGEGSVYEITGQEDTVAKIYDSPVTDEKADKLSTMAGICNNRLLKLSAWPIDTLHEKPGGQIAGFLMQRIREHKGIHVLYSPKSRLSEFPDARWPFLIHCATNLARAFAVIHEQGHVIGDVNHGNVVVSKQATVKLIDCDSFQVHANDRIFTCEVAVSTHTPPELQGLVLKDITRTKNHDGFGFAVLIFQLLFMGRHPFSGEYSGDEEMFLERAIREFRFAYGSDTLSRKMKQPPGTLRLEAVSESVANLFQSAFLQEENRPSATDWITGLEELSQNLCQCYNNKSHAYLKTLARCPWCEIEAKSGALLFNPAWGSMLPNGLGFNLPVVWKQVAELTLPRQPILPTGPSFGSMLRSSEEVIRAWRSNLVYLGLPSLIMLFIGILISYFAAPIDVGLAILILSGAIGIALTHRMANDFLAESTETRDELEKQLHEIKEHWFHERERKQFEDLRTQLQAKKTQYLDLHRFRQLKVQKLEAESKKHRLNEYLRKFSIDESPMPEDSEDVRHLLKMHNVETAADFYRESILAAGETVERVMTGLIEWQRSIEKTFVFNPATDISPSDIEAIDNETVALRVKLERDIHTGQLTLRKISEEVKSVPHSLRPKLNEVLTQIARFDLDARIGAASSVPMALTIISIIISLIIFTASK